LTPVNTSTTVYNVTNFARLDRLEQLAAELDNARQATAGIMAERDELIREALAEGIPYRQLEALTGLSRHGLDKIRKAGNR